jgi:hypothetical protein
MGDQETGLHLVQGGAESEAPRDPVREVDRANRNGSRARKQAAKQTLVHEDADGNVHRKTATTLVIPEEKRCVAMTVSGNRCKVGRMRGVSVCTFHAHLALTDEGLQTLATGEKPRLSPRKALQAVVALRAEELAEGAVSGALTAVGSNRTKAVLALIDSVDPLVQTEETVTFDTEGAKTASWKQLKQAFGF